MVRDRFVLLSAIAMLLLCAGMIQAQEPHDIIRLMDGTALQGRLLTFDGEVFAFEVNGEQREYERSDVHGIDLNRTDVGAQSEHTSLPKAVFSTDEAVFVTWHQLPGKSQNWIAVVPADSPDSTWGTWWYARGAQTGERRIGHLAPGVYEVRVYFDWPQGGYNVRSRLRFTVEGAAAAVGPNTPTIATVGVPAPNINEHVTLPKHEFSTDEKIQIRWHGLPGNNGDWITVVPADSPDNMWATWWYTDGKPEGVRDAGTLAAGDYEVRVYFDWPRGGHEVQSRARFTVR